MNPTDEDKGRMWWRRRTKKIRRTTMMRRTRAMRKTRTMRMTWMKRMMRTRNFFAKTLRTTKYNNLPNLVRQAQREQVCDDILLLPVIIKTVEPVCLRNSL